MDITQLIKELGRAVQNDERCIKYNEVKEANDRDEELQNLMHQFDEKKSELNEVISDPKNNKDRIPELDKEMRELYTTIMENPHMVAYNEVKQEVDLLMNYINRVIVGSFNGQNPEEIPFIEEESCSGSCSSCSGCH